MKIKIKILMSILFIMLLIFSSTSIKADSNDNNELINFDPLSDDVEVTVEIKSIRSLEDFDRQILAFKKLDRFNIPDFFIKIFINGVATRSQIWRNTKYVENPDFSASLVVPSDEEFVDIKIQLWDWNLGLNRLCDISSIHEEGYRDSFDVELTYSIKSGHWFGDDFISTGIWEKDISGYGRLNGCDDGSIYQKDRDCEILFDIYQTDPDGDNIPYWTEVNVYGTNPNVDNTGEDADNDGIPIEWEHKWGHYFWTDWRTGEIYHGWQYHPFEWNNHSNIDPDLDGLDNIEEFMTSQWGSDPFRQDIFLEVDQMEPAPNNQIKTIPDLTWYLLYQPFARRNIIVHIDEGCFGGGEVIPFDQNTSGDELREIYWNYFLHNDKNNWRRGVYRYAVIPYSSDGAGGYVFGTDIDDKRALDGIQMCIDIHEEIIYKNRIMGALLRKTFNKEEQRAIIYATGIMHELGHTLGIFHGNTPGCDDYEGSHPWQKNYWKWYKYDSVMNYGKIFTSLIDYSDGSNGKNDFNDWALIDLTLFQGDLA